jgi:hypothetical protein
MKTNDIKTGIGLSISKGDWDGAQWTITGFPRAEVIGHDYDSAYDFQEAVQRNVNCSGIEFDSEFCQFFAYAKTKARLVSFAKQIEKHYQKAKEVNKKMY